MGLLSNAFTAADGRQEQEKQDRAEPWPWTDAEVLRTELVQAEYTVQLVLDGVVIAEFDRDAAS